MTTITIIPEVNSKSRIFRAICGEQQATGTTPGQALDQIEQVLAEQEDCQSSETLVIVQRFRPDGLFTASCQTRLQDLMTQFHEAVATGEALAPEKQQELENLVEAELTAAIERAANMVQTTQLPQA